ncbi:hypothetical protein CRG98_019768 [Punica granatum]|uniref:Trans-cinnamate 4-monooxygenase n=1 Tax=Punica granatum TaxID=22663 RepID=A0A2I0JWP7_PUNGR|nr:hypothetical protein CRG98_019768 [Punica granatum]
MQGAEFESCPWNIMFDLFMGGRQQDLVFTLYSDHWRKMRKILTVPFFTSKVVQTYSNMWEHEMDLVIDELKKDGSARTEGVVIQRQLQLMLYNITYSMMFNTKFESLDDRLYIELARLNSERGRLTRSFEYNYGDFIPLLRPFLARYLSKCRDLKDRRLAFLNLNFHSKEEDGGITEANVMYLVDNLNIASQDTTLWTLEWTIAELVNHPVIQDKIRDGIMSVLKGEPVKESNLCRLPYLQATVKESLRVHTPVPLLIPHMNLEERKLGGYTIPKESKVVVNAWWLANNLELWKEPEQFRLERFLEEESATEVAAGRKVDFRLITFRTGRRRCPGMILAMPIAGVAIGRLLSNFKIKAPYGLEKVDVRGIRGQFSFRIANHSTVVLEPVDGIIN